MKKKTKKKIKKIAGTTVIIIILAAVLWLFGGVSIRAFKELIRLRNCPKAEAVVTYAGEPLYDYIPEYDDAPSYQRQELSISFTVDGVEFRDVPFSTRDLRREGDMFTVAYDPEDESITEYSVAYNMGIAYGVVCGAVFIIIVGGIIGFIKNEIVSAAEKDRRKDRKNDPRS